MKVKYTHLSDARGKIGGMVASKNRSGNFLRVKVTPINSRTSAQMLVRQRLAAISKDWTTTLTEPQRQAWNDAALTVDKKNVFGDTYQPTGKNLFTLCNLNRFSVGVSSLLTSPAPTPSFPVATLEVSDAKVSTVEVVMQDVPSTLRVAFDATPNLNAGIGYFRGRFKFVTSKQPDMSDEATLTGADIAAVTATPVVGKKIAVQAKIIDPVSGFASVPLTTSFVVLPD